jgi:hypothetical protein
MMKSEKKKEKGFRVFFCFKRPNKTLSIFIFHFFCLFPLFILQKQKVIEERTEREERERTKHTKFNVYEGKTCGWI